MTAYNRGLSSPSQAPSKLRWIGPAAALLAVLGVAWATWYFGLFERFADRDELVEFLRADGWRGPLLLIAVQFVQVILFAIPGEITQVAAGYVFGAWLGFLYSFVGILIGSGTAFLVGRMLGRPLSEKLLGEEALKKLDRAVDSGRGRTAVFLLFLLPGAPKDAMSYGAGVSGMPFLEFLLISNLGRTPALLFSTLFGAQLEQRDYVSMAITAAAVGLVLLVFWRYQKRLALS